MRGHGRLMDVLSGLGLRSNNWNPLRLLARFRASVSARLKRQRGMDQRAGPVEAARGRKQSLGWVADSGLKIQVCGAGWEQRPRLSTFARPYETTDAQRSAIAQLGKINLRLTPCSADD